MCTALLEFFESSCNSYYCIERSKETFLITIHNTFKIKQQTELVTFKLELSKYFKTHFIIHTALMKSALENTKLTKIMNAEKYENQNYIVEKILAKNQINKINHYLVK